MIMKRHPARLFTQWSTLQALATRKPYSAFADVITMEMFGPEPTDSYTLTFDGRAITYGGELVTYGYIPSATGDLAATESGSDTASMAGKVLVKASIAVTEAAKDTASASGKVLVKGTIAATDGADTASASAKAIVKGALAASEVGKDSASASAAVIVDGVLAASENAPDSASMWVQTRTYAYGDLLATEDARDAAAISAVVRVQGSLSVKDQGQDAAEASGKVLVDGELLSFEAAKDSCVSEVAVRTPVELTLNASAIYSRALLAQRNCGIDSLPAVAQIHATHKAVMRVTP